MQEFHIRYWDKFEGLRTLWICGWSTIDGAIDAGKHYKRIKGIGTVEILDSHFLPIASVT